MTLDLLIAIALTASAALVIFCLTAFMSATTEDRARYATILAAWFVLAVVLAATHVLTPDGLGTPGVGLAVVIPILLLVYFARRPGLWSAVQGIPLPVFVAVNAVRAIGVFFVILYAQDRLPAPFAPLAGWGDVLIGLTALPVAWMIARRSGGWRPAAWLWNIVGATDLITAIALGVMSAADSPMQVFSGGPDTTVMSILPMFLIPGFLVPLLFGTHLAVFYRLYVERPRRAAA